MLIHTSQRKGEMATIAGRLKDLWDQCAFNSPQGCEICKTLWDEDFEKVCTSKGSELTPATFDELIPIWRRP